MGLSRSSYYYSPMPETEENINLMTLIEEIHYRHPEYGYRKIHAQLRRDGRLVNEKRVERLWGILGFLSILPRPNLSKSCPENAHFPYLLNGMWIGAANQVFSIDITFLPLANGYVYLCAICDWFSRRVMSWEISNTMTVDFCIVALERALKQAIPEYFNTDQGSQFTSKEFIEKLQEYLITISMDGKGRCIDNVYQERAWWSLKYECIYLYRPETVLELIKLVREYFNHFNTARPHQALLYATPDEIYYKQQPKFSKGLYTGYEVKKANSRGCGLLKAI